MQVVRQSLLLILAVCLGAGSVAPSRAADRRPIGDGPSSQPVSGDEEMKKLLPPIRPIEPREALKTFQIPESLELQLAAAEPLITDPIAVAWDEDGRLYVAEMRDYPYNPTAPDKALGRVRLLEDRDNDGEYETSTVFADRVHWPSGIAPYRGGVFVAAPPDIFYMKDTDGDGVADEKRVIFTGWGTNAAEDIMNNLEWGLDHWVYGASSYNGGEMRALEHPEDKPQSTRGRDFRFDPLSHRIQPIPGAGDFGNGFDDWGNRFVCSSGEHIMHDVVPAHYLTLNPYLPLPRLVHNVAAGEDRDRVYPISGPEPWRVVREKFWSRWVDTTPDMNAGRFPPRELAPQGWVTGTAGVKIYRGHALPDEYRGNAFIAEPAGNLIIRNVLTPAGATFEARRPTPNHDFMASTDNWFRPVNSNTGPDGCLYILDMYREFIEDPSAIPEDILKHLNMLSGNDRGRIYRVAPKGFARPLPRRLSQAGTGELVELLADPNGWMRETAHRLIFERQDQSAASPLRAMLRSNPSPQGRLHALWSLNGLNALDEAAVLAALSDAHPAVREHAVRLAEKWFQRVEPIRRKVISLADDPQPRVRFQVALSLGLLADKEVVGVLAAMADRDLADGWIRMAVLNAAAERSADLLESLLSNRAFLDKPEAGLFLSALVGVTGARNDTGEVGRVVSAPLGDLLKDHARLRRQLIVGVATGLGRAGNSLQKVLASLKTGVPHREMLTTLFHECAVTVADVGRSQEERIEAVRLLAHAPIDILLEPLAELLNPREPQRLQLAAIQALSVQTDARVGAVLVAHWGGYTPPLRREAVEALFARGERLPALLDAIENGRIPPGQLDPARRKGLLGHADQTIRRRAEQLLSNQSPGDRQAVVERYHEALKLPGDATRGLAVYEKNCMTCHRAGKKGFAVGPNVTEMQKRTAEELITHILDPNREVQPNYINYLVITSDGRDITGILAGESATGVTLRRSEGVEETVLRSNIQEMRSTHLSIMPEELESAVSVQDMADLIRFIQSQ